MLLIPMLLIHEVCHSSKIYLLIDDLKFENGILKEVGSNESDVHNSSIIRKKGFEKYQQSTNTNKKLPNMQRVKIFLFCDICKHEAEHYVRPK